MKSYSAQWLCSTTLLVSTCLLLACGSGGPYVSPTQHPLVAEYSVPTSQGGDLSVEFGTDTSYGRKTASYPVIPGSSSILVAGMKPSTTYHMRAQLSNAGGVVWSDQDRVFTTGSIPAPIPAITVTRTPDPALQASENPGVELVTFFSASAVLNALVTDRDGNPIWYYPGTVSFFKPMPNGHMLIATAVGKNSVMREIDLAGKTIQELSTPVLQQALQNQGYNLNLLNFSHDFIPMNNGHVIALLQISQDFADLPGYPGTTNVLGDALVDLDENWNPVWVWSAFDHLDVNRHPMFFPDWTHSNAVLYNANDGNLLLSIRHQSWIIYIDYQNGAGSGNILWKLGNQGDFNLSNSSDIGDWFYAQHFPSFINLSGPQMTLAVFDNGDNREDDQDAICGTASDPCYSRATVFQLDQSTMQAQLSWQFPPGFYSPWGGAINQLQNGNVEFEMSQPFASTTTASLAMEVTQTGAPQVIWQMELSGGNSYRTYRIPSLYPNVTWP